MVTRTRHIDKNLYILALLRGTIVNSKVVRSYLSTYFPIFTNNIWSYLLWSPVIVILLLRGTMANRTYGNTKA